MREAHGGSLMVKPNGAAPFIAVVFLTGIAIAAFLSCTPKSPIDPTSSIGDGVAVLTDIEAVPSSISTGGSPSTIRVRLLDDSAVPIAGETIQFSTTLGTLSSENAVTDSEGRVQVQLTAGAETGTAQVSATYENSVATVSIQIISSYEAQIKLQSGRQSILANGIDTTMVLVQVLGDSAQPAANQEVSLVQDIGTLSYSGTTDDQGMLKAMYTSAALSSDSTAYIRAQWDTLEQVLMIDLRGVRFFMESASSTILADGESGTVIQARLKETATDIAIPDGEITFGANLGSIPASAVTNSSGIAQVTLTSEEQEGTAQVVGRYGSTLYDTVFVDFVRSTYTVDITATPEKPLANGIDNSEIKVTVHTAAGNPASNIQVGFSTTHSTIASQKYTNSSGVATALLGAMTNEEDQTAVVSVTVDGVTYEKQVTFSAVQRIATADPNSIVADGESTSSISVLLKKKTSQVAINGAQIVFATDLGTIDNTATTDSRGVAAATLHSGTEMGTAHVTVQYGNLPADTVLVSFTGATTGYSIAGSGVSDPAILANGFDKSTVYVSVADGEGEPAQGAVVSFSANHGSLSAGQAVTNTDGLASVDLYADTSRTNTTALVTANVGAQSVQMSVLFEGLTWNMSAQPSSIVADGQSTSLITFSLKKTGSNIAVSDAAIQFGTTAGAIPNQAVTNNQGIASVSLTSGTTPGTTAQVSASYGQKIILSENVAFVSEVQGGDELKELSVEAGDWLANGFDQVEVQALVEDGQGSPAQGVEVAFTSTIGTISASAVTNAQGIAQAVLTAPFSSSDVSGTVTAEAGTQNITSSQISFAGIEYSLSASPDSILADGKSTSTIRFTLKKTQSHVAVPGAVIEFGTDAGTIPNQAVTNSQGVAQVELTSSTTSGDLATVTASYGPDVNENAYVRFTSEAPSTNLLKSIAVQSGSYLANGLDVLTVSAIVHDDAGVPVLGEAVEFSVSSGTITSQGVTDESGLATAVWTAPASRTTQVETATAHLGAQTKESEAVSFAGITPTITAVPDTIIANGTSVSTIKVTVKRTDNNVAVSGAPIVFSTDYGTIPNQAATNSQGVAEVELTSSISPHTATVTGRYGPDAVLQESIPVRFRQSTPTYLNVSVTPPVIPADGNSKAVIKASVSDEDHNPVPDGTAVSFRLGDNGTGTLETRKETDGGVASSNLISGVNPDTVKVFISVGSLRDSVKVVYQVGNADKVLVSTEKDTIKADGQETSRITAEVMDAQGNPVPGATVSFTATVGSITPSAKTNDQGTAVAQFSSGVVGIATIEASVSNAGGSQVSGLTTVILEPGAANTVRLSFDPEHIGVKGTGQNQTTTIFADVRDAKNNPVADGTMVQFEIYAQPGGCQLSSSQPAPTTGGVAQISFTSGIRSGNARIKAVVLDDGGSPLEITAASTEILIHAGPPYIENVNDPSTSHLTVFVKRQNIWAGLDTTVVTVLVGDRYNNPVDQGTAVYLTTSGGVITTQSFTDSYGLVNDTLMAGQPYPTIDRYYNYEGMMLDPNLGTVLNGPVYYPELGRYGIPNFEQDGIYYPAQAGGSVTNSEGNTVDNDGMAHIMAYSEGMDEGGNTAKAWSENAVIMSTGIDHFYIDDSALPDTLHPGESATIMVEIWDTNGNPISAGSKLFAENYPGTGPAALSWTAVTTGNGWGTCFYPVTISNAVNPEKPKEGYASVKIIVESPNGGVSGTSRSVFIAME